jgi:LPS-assembly protein
MARVPFKVARFAILSLVTGLEFGMHPRTLVFITLLALCRLHLEGQALTNGVPPAPQAPAGASPATPTGPVQNRPGSDDTQIPSSALPDDPDQQMLPVAQPEPPPASGVPVEFEAQQQTRIGDVLTLTGDVVIHYKDYILRADKVVYHQPTTEMEAEGHVQVAGGPNDVLINADHGDMRLNMHTGRFFKVNGSQGIRTAGRTVVYSTANPFLFSGRVLIQTGEGNYRIVDGSMTNCRLPKPDWQLLSRTIDLTNGEASTRNSIFEFLGIPLFYLPYLRHPVDDTGRETGFMIPVLSNSSIKGFIVGEQFYWVISRSMDMIVGSEFYSKRGWAPNGDFRYKGAGLDHLIVRWNALLDRGVEEQVSVTTPAGSARTGTQPDSQKGSQPGVQQVPSPTSEAGQSTSSADPAATTTTTELVNQGGVDVVAEGRKDLSPQTRVAGVVEYLSSYVYRLVFNDNYSQAISSEVSSDLSLTHEHNGFIPSISLDRFQTFASSTNGDEARILHLPNLRYDVLDRPLSASPLYWGLGSSLDYLSRSEPAFHARNVGRVDFYPHLSLPLSAGGWSVVPEVALRDTFYSGGQSPDLTGANGGTPTISHNALNRADIEAGVDIRPPAVERDFELSAWNRELRHVIEPELTYRFVGGIGVQARNVLLVDTTDIATNTNEVGFSLTQRFYLRPLAQSTAQSADQSVDRKPCKEEEKPADRTTGQRTDRKSSAGCAPKPREWASWQVAQKFFFDPNFGGAIIPNRRNVFDSTLDLTGVAFLTEPRNFSPLISRLRFEAIDNLRIEWDLDFDPKTGRLDSDNLFAGYSWGNTTVGIGHAMLNAVDENNGAASTIQSQQLQPFVSIGKQSSVGFNFAANAGYDFVQHSLQYAAVQAVYNWNCCGLTVGYRRFELGSIRDETQYLYSFTLANFGSVGDIRRSNSVFRDPTLPPAY